MRRDIYKAGNIPTIRHVDRLNNCEIYFKTLGEIVLLTMISTCLILRKLCDGPRCV